jgi:hypothetical protein
MNGIEAMWNDLLASFEANGKASTHTIASRKTMFAMGALAFSTVQRQLISTVGGHASEEEGAAMLKRLHNEADELVTTALRELDSLNDIPPTN